MSSVGSTRFAAVRVAITCGLMLVALLASSAVAAPRLYELTPPSNFQEGCYATCTCPVSRFALRGWFFAVPAGVDETFEVFAIRRVTWFLSASRTPWARGFGVYRVDRDAGVQRLELDLRIRGRGVEHFDSGLVPVEVDGPVIDALVSIHGLLSCFDTAFDVRALPVKRGKHPEDRLAPDPPPGTWGAVKDLYRR